MQLRTARGLVRVHQTPGAGADICAIAPRKPKEPPRVLVSITGDGHEASVQLELQEALAIGQMLIVAAMTLGGMQVPFGEDPLAPVVPA
jgi:hypothetical protein